MSGEIAVEELEFMQVELEKAEARTLGIQAMLEKPGFRFDRSTGRVIADDRTWQKYMNVKNPLPPGIRVLMAW